MNTPCSHTRVLVISQDDNGKFLECLDCREIFESSELEALEKSQAEQPKPDQLSEDLSDA
jgi:hypothetical protein